MTTEQKPEGQTEEKRTAFTQRYGQPSEVVGKEGVTNVAISADTQRDPVQLKALVKNPLMVREALSALYEIVQSDFSYKPKDRTAYLAYQRMKQQSASLSTWQAQQAYFDWLSRNDPNAWMILDPIVSVHPDGLTMEVFSKDEGLYAQLHLGNEVLDYEGDTTCGTTNIDFSKTLFDGVQRMREYRKTYLTVGNQADESLKLETEGSTVVEKKVSVPDSWLRGFLQVQSAAALETVNFSMAPMDLYNALRQLRMNADRKKGGRAIRVELLPGEYPRLTMEPWDYQLTTSEGQYQGKKPRIIRLWGRRRLMLIRRFLPFVDQVDVRLLGSGLPSFFILRGKGITLTVALSGYSSANWSQSLVFDVLLPRSLEADKNYAKIEKQLQKQRQATAEELAQSTKLNMPDLLKALQYGCQNGTVMYDLSCGMYRLRPLGATPLDEQVLLYRNDKEKVAHDLLQTKKAVSIAKENNIYGVGLELSGLVKVAAEKREYTPQVLLNEEGRVRQAECTCAFYRKHQLKEGPCEHLIALRLLQARQAEEKKGKKDNNVTVETRTFARRKATAEQIMQVCLDRKNLKIRFGARSDERLRVQNFIFDSTDEARSAYFAHVERIENQGYIDQGA